MNSFLVYHSLLRVTSLLVAFVLVMQSGVVHPSTRIVTQNTQLYVANAVSMSLGIAPNELNQITAQLTARERELAQRESVIREREIAVGLNQSSSGTGVDRTTYVLSAILFILLVLIIMNYILDFTRRNNRNVSWQ